jgi:hypothetical protein
LRTAANPKFPGYKVWLLWHQPKSSLRTAAWVGRGRCQTIPEFLERARSDDCKVVIMRSSDLLVMPPMTRHSVLTVWRKNTPLGQQWCVLGGRNFATAPDIQLAAARLDRMCAAGGRRDADGPNGWTNAWQALWGLYLRLNPSKNDVTDKDTRLGLLRGKKPDAPPKPIGRVLNRKRTRQENMAKARANNPNHIKKNKNN